MYDITAGEIETPAGIGKFVGYDSARQKVTVELDHTYIVEFDADKCFITNETQKTRVKSHKK